MAVDVVATKYWHLLGDGRVQCDLCPRFCKLNEGQRGLCFVRAREDDAIVLTTYGRSSGFCIDPIEKKPLNHFYPGSSVLSFGTAGCNLACQFCQNWDISKSREVSKLSDQGVSRRDCARGSRERVPKRGVHLQRPDHLSRICRRCRRCLPGAGRQGRRGDGGLHHRETSRRALRASRRCERGPEGFHRAVYKKICAGALAPVLDTLCYIARETDVWLELTTLLIPGENDSDGELDEMTAWVVENLGPDVPIHFTAFHPDWKMLDKPSTPPETLSRARSIAARNGVRFPYTGNVHDKDGGSTYCHACGEILIGRDWYELSDWNLSAVGRCRSCGATCPGVFAEHPGRWGSRRQPVRL